MGWVQVREGLAKLKAMNDGKGPPAPPSKRGGSEAGPSRPSVGPGVSDNQI